jgi:hypothetical protein
MLLGGLTNHPANHPAYTGHVAKNLSSFCL